MLTLHEHPGTNVIEFSVNGGITKTEFQNIADKIDAVIALYGNVRLIEVIHKIGSIEPAALWADLKFGPSHLKYFTHVAVVADQKWIEWITKASRPFLSAQMRVFHINEIDDARTWITQAKEEPES